MHNICCLNRENCAGVTVTPLYSPPSLLCFHFLKLLILLALLPAGTASPGGREERPWGAGGAGSEPPFCEGSGGPRGYIKAQPHPGGSLVFLWKTARGIQNRRRCWVRWDLWPQRLAELFKCVLVVERPRSRGSPRRVRRDTAALARVSRRGGRGRWLSPYGQRARTAPGAAGNRSSLKSRSGREGNTDWTRCRLCPRSNRRPLGMLLWSAAARAGRPA